MSSRPLPRVLALTRYASLGASSRLRILQYLPALKNAGMNVTVSPLFNDNYVRALYAKRMRLDSVLRGYLRRMITVLRSRDYDLIWLEKEVFPWLPQCFELGLLPRNCKLAVDYDDAIFHRYDKHQSGLVRRTLGKKVDAVMRRANLVITGNAYLEDWAIAVGASRVERFPTVVDLKRYPSEPVRQSDNEVTIGWIGSPSTAVYLRQLAPVLEILKHRYAIRCIAVGVQENQVEGTAFKAVEWTESTEIQLLSQFNIGVMPLPDEPWERGKCGYKLIQYMACGLPVVASPVGINREIVVRGENGELANSTSEWVSALERLIVNPDLRRSMGQRGRRTVEQWYSLQVQAPRLVGMLRSVMDEL